MKMQYIESFTAMVQLEVMENSKRLTQYDIENVQLVELSRADQTFQIEFEVNKFDVTENLKEFF